MKGISKDEHLNFRKGVKKLYKLKNIQTYHPSLHQYLVNMLKKFRRSFQTFRKQSLPIQPIRKLTSKVQPMENNMRRV